MFLYLLASFIVVNLAHCYLLVSQKHSRGLAISEHAAANTTSHVQYALAHFAGGFAFLLFALQIFESSPLLLSLSIVGVVTEWFQALIPARHKYEIYHMVMAYGMSALMTLIGALTAFLLPMNSLLKYIIILISLVILCGYPAVIILPKKHFWKVEMLNINLFYLQMFILVFSTKN